ncbi:hypothetical protein ANN_10174 [Periplaneta americana]|uniref:Uncharacterized protein n=1 Tax=Periplaneta americana TaxID=6978 RepID=A0ABQ8TPW1_PERAM|nr:hypothetical protein ANN_10174 [Periplaneta americana]
MNRNGNSHFKRDITKMFLKFTNRNAGAVQVRSISSPDIVGCFITWVKPMRKEWLNCNTKKRLKEMDDVRYREKSQLPIHAATIYPILIFPTYRFISLRPKYFPKHLILKNPSPLFLSQSESPSFKTIQNNR